MESGSPKKAQKPNPSQKAKRRRRPAKRTSFSWNWLYGVFLGFVLMGFILGLFPTPEWIWGLLIAGAFVLILTIGPRGMVRMNRLQRFFLRLIALVGAIAIAAALAIAMNLGVEVKAEISDAAIKSLLGDITLVTALVVMGVGALTITLVEANGQLLKTFNQFGTALVLSIVSGIGLGVGLLFGTLLSLE